MDLVTDKFSLMERAESIRLQSSGMGHLTELDNLLLMKMIHVKFGENIKEEIMNCCRNAFILNLVFLMMASIPVVYGNWTVEIADDAAAVGRYSSLKMDRQDRPHISYYDETNGNLKYAYKTGSGWQHETVYETGDAGTFTNLVLDSNDHPMISFHDEDEGRIRMSWKSTGSWSSINIALTGGSHPCNRIALDSQDHFYVAYVLPESSDYKLRITYTDGSDLFLYYVQDGAGDIGLFSMVMNGGDQPCLAYGYPVDAEKSNLKYAVHTPSDWQYEVDSFDEDSGYSSSLMLDSDGYPHVAHRNIDGYLLYSYRDAGGWHNTVTDYPVSAYISMVLDSDRYPHVMSTNGLDNSVHHMYADAEGWHDELVFEQTVAGAAYASLSIDSQDELHASFYSRGDATLRYATRSVPVTPTPTHTPVPPTPTACMTTGVEINMPLTLYLSGDDCYCTAVVCNAEGHALTGYPLFVILDVYGTYFFAPSFNSTFDNYLSLYPSYPNGPTIVEVLPVFSWPSGAGSASGIIWYAAMTNPEMNALFGSMDTFTFGWED